MQQTNKYKLNLIERDDVFSPDALNENTQKVENALTAHEGAVKNVTDGLAGQTADLSQRVTALEVHKIAVGKYMTSSQSLTINVGFAPVAVLIQVAGTETGIMTAPSSDSSSAGLVSNGFYLTAGCNFNRTGGLPHYYVALA